MHAKLAKSMYENYPRPPLDKVIQTLNAILVTRFGDILRARQARIQNPLPDFLLLNVEDRIVWTRINHDVQVPVVLGRAAQMERERM